MKTTEKVIVIVNGERIGLLYNTEHQIGHYMASVPIDQELQFKQTDGQTVLKCQWRQIREVADPEWFFYHLAPLIEYLARNNNEIQPMPLLPLDDD